MSTPTSRANRVPARADGSDKVPLEQGTLSQSELTALNSEDNHGVIQVEGRWVQVEFNQDGADEADSDSEDASSSEDSGGGECRVDSGAGNTSGVPANRKATRILTAVVLIRATQAENAVSVDIVEIQSLSTQTQTQGLQ